MGTTRCSDNWSLASNNCRLLSPPEVRSNTNFVTRNDLHKQISENRVMKATRISSVSEQFATIQPTSPQKVHPPTAECKHYFP